VNVTGADEHHADNLPIVAVRGLSKAYGGAAALEDVSIDIRRGQVHGLVGANGAGKSTLIKCLAGLEQPDTGAILIDGMPVTIGNAHQADQLGLSFIHQELSLVPRFDTFQNVLLGLNRHGVPGSGRARGLQHRVTEVATSLGIGFPLDVPVAGLSVADQWMVSIARALVRRARVIAMDEPTASLSQEEATRLLAVTRELAASGIAILYVSHRLPEILALCDQVSVFRNGRKTTDIAGAEITNAALIAGITGRRTDLEQAYPPRSSTGERPKHDRPPALELRGVTTPQVHDVSMTVAAGEVVGLAGLVGSGRTEVANAIFGLDRLSEGTLLRDGRPIVLRGPADAMRAGIGLVPEERRAQALLLARPIHVNVNLAALGRFRWRRWLPLVNRRLAVRSAGATCERLLVKHHSLTQPVGALSGGNQQKVVIGRWVSRECDVLVLDELSRGVDIAARAEIHALLRSYATQGHAVLAISSEPDELIAFCDRIYVMHERTISGELAADAASETAIIELSYGHSPKPALQEAR
jgi:ribose transport system ATP-binding protein